MRQVYVGEIMQRYQTKDIHALQTWAAHIAPRLIIGDTAKAVMQRVELPAPWSIVWEETGLGGYRGRVAGYGILYTIDVWDVNSAAG